MKVLLTGATGFLGSHILKALIEHNIETVVLKRSFSSNERIQKYSDQFISYNIDNISLHEIFVNEPNICTVIHCATNYGRKTDEVYEVFKSNVEFPLQLLEMVNYFNIKTFINTDSFFGKATSVKGYMQNYILTKNQFLDWGKLFAESEKITFINMRLEHIYGGNDDKSKFIPFVINNCLNNVESIDLTDGEQFRDFIYVDDVVSAYLTVLSSCKQFKGYCEFEVGSGKSVKVKDFVITVKDILNSDTNLNFGALPHRKNEILHSNADISNLLKLGWYPKYDVQNGIKAYINEMMQG